MGKIVIPAQFNGISRFSEGLAIVSINGKYGFIDRTGKIVISPQFDDTYGFSKGLAGVWIDGKLGYIDQTGKFVWNLTK
jgi:hypothetical protein